MSEICLKLQVDAIEEGGYIATSPDIPGLVTQGRTLAETMEIAHDVARKLDVISQPLSGIIFING